MSVQKSPEFGKVTATKKKKVSNVFAKWENNREQSGWDGISSSWTKWSQDSQSCWIVSRSREQSWVLKTSIAPLGGSAFDSIWYALYSIYRNSIKFFWDVYVWVCVGVYDCVFLKMHNTSSLNYRTRLKKSIGITTLRRMEVIHNEFPFRESPLILCNQFLLNNHWTS